MKKGFISLIIIMLFIYPVLAATSCSDGSKPVSSDAEIEIGSAKVINGLGIGLSKTEEIALKKRIGADLFLDSRKVDLTNESNSETVNLLSGDYDIVLTNYTDTTATISVDGESQDLPENEVQIINGLLVMVSSAEEAEGGKVRVIIGVKQLNLSNIDNPAEASTFKNKTYLTELISASHANAIISVSYCNTGEIVYETGKASSQTQETTNQTEVTTNTTETDIAAAEELPIEPVNESINSEPTPPVASPESNSDQSFFGRLWQWIKNFFS